MRNVLIAGVGGQGSVLGAKILAQAASSKGWQVRTAETIGMAQRGGSVTSHVRMGNLGEQVHAPLVVEGTADCVIALEPGEAVRALPFLASGGLLVTATTPVPSVIGNLAGDAYEAGPFVDHLRTHAAHFAAIDEAAICQQVGSPKVANVVMLGAAIYLSCSQGVGLQDALSIEDLQLALASCVKPQFVELNERAIAATVAALR